LARKPDYDAFLDLERDHDDAGIGSVFLGAFCLRAKKMTVLIKNGLVYDGAGNAPVKKDIVIQNKRIARLGSFLKKDADLVLDATGMAVTPGLIDVGFRAESFAGILADPVQADLIQNGITTAIGGNNGVSLAPAFGNLSDFLKEWGFYPRSNLHWRTMKEFLEVLRKKGVGINFGTLAGYSIIRHFFTGNAARDLTEGEHKSVIYAVNRSLKEGALGVSLDLSSPYANRIPTREILEMAKEAAKSKRLCAIHPRFNGERLASGIEEILEVGEATGASMEISRFQPLQDFRPLYEEALGIIEKETAQSHANFDIFHRPVAEVPIHSFLPEWLVSASTEEMLAALKEKTVKERILKHLQKEKLEGIVIAEAPAGLKFLEGKSLEDFARNHGSIKARALFNLMILTGLKANLLRRAADGKILEEYLKNKHSMVLPKEGFFAWAAESGKLPLQEAVAKTTGLPAEKYRLEKRGLIKESYWADLVLWENWKPRTVFINGSMVMRDGLVEKNMAGMVLKANKI
jgi:N-acyl-D-amino-acid deacylase